MCLVRPMANRIEGGCLCGGVRYRLYAQPKQGSDCHCEDCRRASAAPYVTWCSVPSKAIDVLSGELRRVSYADRLRSFASCCGTPLFVQDEVRSEWIDVTVASLDDPKTFPRRSRYGQKTNSRGFSSIRVSVLFGGAEMKTPNHAPQSTSFSWMSRVAIVLPGAATCAPLNRG